MSSVVKTCLKNKLISTIVIQQVRFYPRWNHRRPMKVYTSEEYEETRRKEKNAKEVKKTNLPDFSTFIKDEKINWEQSKQDTIEPVEYKIKTKKYLKSLIASDQRKAKVQTTDMLETVLDEKGNFIYTKMKNNDHRIGTILTEIKSKKEKTKKNLLLLEGKRLIKDAILSGCHLKYILLSRKNDVEYLKPYLPKMGVNLYKMPYREMQLWSDLTTNPGIMGIFNIPSVEKFQPKESLPFTLICDNIREPGNLGAILRICAGVGCDRVILSKGCVNLWDSKVLRSSSGAHFKLRIQKDLEWNQIEKEINECASIFIADNKIVCSSNSERNEELESIVRKIPLLPYYSVDFKIPKHTVLIVGGETLGVSRNSYEIAHKLNGVRLNIPLSNDVDSLNVGAALGVIAFELKKQLIQQSVNK